MKLATIILAAGEGTRMKSDLPKVLHPLAGRPMLTHVINICQELEPERIIVVVGHKREEVIAAIGGISTAHQSEQKGTGHAVLTTEDLMRGFDGPVLVLAGDVPLIQAATLRSLLEVFVSDKPAASLVTADVENPHGYGRILRDRAGAVTRIIEENEADAEERAIKEINAGIYCFNSRRLFNSLEMIGNDNSKSEYYLTDVVSVLKSQGETVLACPTDAKEILGVNSRAELARAESIVQQGLKNSFMAGGVTFLMPETTYIEMDVKIENDVEILPNCFLQGKTKIAKGAQIGPNTRINDSVIGGGSQVQYAVLNGVTVDAKVNVGPFCSIRPGSHLMEGSKVGTFVELKASKVGSKSKVPHLTYLGDTDVGENVNIGAGTITCNYDGTEKHKTVIEDEAFIGSDTMLISPVTIGRGAVTGAGSSISKDVPPDSLSVERAEQKIVHEWAKKRRAHKPK